MVTINITEVGPGATQTGSAATQVQGAAGGLSRQSAMMKSEGSIFWKVSVPREVCAICGTRNRRRRRILMCLNSSSGKIT